ncbi:prephenate dehydratase [Flocculibacter collagenilyticus]|uniref:prephenate dehydratase n=1 Tax=Flocculibacter collagenilyticus TaxID=2744479 RepID=UPI0018F495F3|nr:prephenate dehydratase [Flocculibacter collagenilyticus]
MNTEQHLSALRNDINEIDSDILVLLAKRRRIANLVAESKLNSKKAVRDLEREEAMLINLISYGKSLGLDAHYVTQLFHVIIEDSVLHQQALLQRHQNPDISAPTNRVAFLGNQGSYSYLAMQKYFSRRPGKLVELGCKSFDEIITTVEKGLAEYAILPIENTSSGSINEVYDVLQHTTLSIVGELTHPINHCLLTATDTTLDNVDTFFGHPQVFAQCSHFLRNLPNVHIEYCDSTSSAFQQVKKLNAPNIAAIGSAEGGKSYGLTVLEEALANQKENHSRFIVVARKAVNVAHQIPAKTTLIMSTEQKPGALVDVLSVLKKHDVNMCKLESRPINGNPWEEMFYVDVEANINAENVKVALSELTQITPFLKVLGCYPSENIRPVNISSTNEA